MKKFIASLFFLFAVLIGQSSQAQGNKPKSPNRSDNHVPPGHGGTPPGQGGPKPGEGPKPFDPDKPGNGPKNKNVVSVSTGGTTIKPTVSSPKPSVPQASNTTNWPAAPERPVISGKKN